MLSPKPRQFYKPLPAKELRAKSLKLKGLDGAPHQPRGACPIIDNPRHTPPALEPQPIYRRHRPPNNSTNSGHNRPPAKTSGQGVANGQEEMGYIFFHRAPTSTMKTCPKDGFSSKFSNKSLTEARPGARTHRPSPSSSQHPNSK